MSESGQNVNCYKYLKRIFLYQTSVCRYCCKRMELRTILIVNTLQCCYVSFNERISEISILQNCSTLRLTLL